MFIYVSCFDNIFCNGEEICDTTNGCIVGVVLIFDDNIDCIMDVCDEINDVIMYMFVYVQCSDGVFCNGPEVC